LTGEQGIGVLDVPLDFSERHLGLSDAIGGAMQGNDRPTGSAADEQRQHNRQPASQAGADARSHHAANARGKL
jgi:hypothetical protein